MSQGNPHVRFDSVPYSAARSVLPVESLSPEVWARHDIAAEWLESVPASDILAVAPESMATGYKLAQMPLTVVSLDDLPVAVRTSVVEAASGDYSLLVLGRATNQVNHRLREYV
jgi:hypothetical protein